MSRPSKLQLFKDESWNYFTRNYEGKDLRSIPPNDDLVRALEVAQLDLAGGAVLEIGCGCGRNLRYINDRYGLSRAVGIEPSAKLIRELKQALPELEFHSCHAHQLPFDVDSFDLVILRSVLLWVDRNLIFQTIGEACRVTKSHLLISDFSPPKPYSVVYHHKPAYRTYKMDYRALIESCHFMECIDTFSRNADDAWSGNQTSMYRKMPMDEAFPLRSEADVRGESPTRQHEASA